MNERRPMTRLGVFLVVLYALGYFAGCFHNGKADREVPEDAAFQRELERPGNPWDFTQYITDQPLQHEHGNSHPANVNQLDQVKTPSHEAHGSPIEGQGQARGQHR